MIEEFKKAYPLVSLYFSCSDIQQKEKDGKVIVALPRKIYMMGWMNIEI